MDNPQNNQPEQENLNAERFESDTHKIVRRHLQDKNHVITEDEIRSVRVGMTPPVEELENVQLSTELDEQNIPDNNDPAIAPLTSWGTVEP